MQRLILHMDMDAFFAAVEEKRRPGIRGKPVVIGGYGDPTRRGVVSTASYAARKFGIHSAMPLRTAYRLCPDAIFLPVDYKEYLRVSGEVKAILRSFSPVMEDVGIDEAFLDVTSIEAAPEEISSTLKERISAETGLTCSIGIAPNKLLAKIASDMQKPDGLTVLAESDIEQRIWPLPTRKLWGVGPKTEATLNTMGITTIGDIASLPEMALIEHFGNSYGTYLFKASRGIDERPLVTHWEPKSISRETTFEHDCSNWQVLAKHLAQLARETVDGLKDSGYRGRTVTVKVRYSDFKTVTRATTLEEPSSNGEVIRRAAFSCLGRIETKGRRIRLIGLRIDKLEKGNCERELGMV